MDKKRIQAPVIRKARDTEDWLNQVERLKVGNRSIAISKIIELEENAFSELCNNFFAYRDYIAENLNEMFFDEKENCWHMIAVICDSKDYAVLIDAEGFHYARYTSIVKKEEIGAP